MLIVGRIISGIAAGLSSAVVPIYQSEITEPAIRGRIVSLQVWYNSSILPLIISIINSSEYLRSITWGILLQYFIQFGCSYIDGVGSFRIPWGLKMIPAIILSLGFT